MVANGGVYAVDLLAYDPDYPAEIAVYCIQALAAIGGDKALDALAAYADDERPQVRRAIGDAWMPVRGAALCRPGVGRLRSVGAVGHTRPTRRGCGCCPSLTQLTLDLSGTAVGDLGPLAGLTQLTQLDLDLEGTAVGDLALVGRADPAHAA